MTSPFQNHIALVTGSNDPEGLGFGSIHDIAHAVRFLCHPDSGLITGEVLMVDGGWTLA